MELPVETASDQRYDERFDFDFAARLLLEIAQERSLEGLMEQVISGISHRTQIARVEFWLIKKGDICSRCPQSAACPDHTSCLHLAAAGNNPLPGSGREASRIYHSDERIPLGAGIIGRIAATGKQIELHDINEAPREVADPGWWRLEQIRGFGGATISFRGEVLGVFALFSRIDSPPEGRTWRQLYADYIGSAIANTRAFEEIRQTGERLEQANQKLEQELAERKAAEEKLRESEQRYRRIVDTASEGIWELDEQYVTTLVNPRMAEMLGYKPAEMVGRPLAEFLFDDDHALLPARIAARRQGVTERFEQKYRRKDGGMVWMHVSATSVRDAGHRFIGSFAMLTDITERKLAEEALRRTADYLAETQKLTQTGTFASDETTKPLFWSEEHFHIFGFDPQHGLPTRDEVLQRIHPEDVDKLLQAYGRVIREKVDSDVEYRIVLPDGTLKHAYGQGHPVLNSAGQLVEIVGTTVDITERKRVEEELRKHRDHLEDLVKQRTEELALLNQLVYGSLESGEVGAWWIDFREEDTTHALDNTARMVGLEPDPTGKKAYKLSVWNKMLTDTAAKFPEHAAIIEQTLEKFAGCISGQYQNFRSVHPMAMPDGSVKWLDSRAEVAKRFETGQAQLMTGTLIDVTRSKQGEAELAEAKTRAEVANRAKSMFLANMSHELRTPLNAVLGFSRLLKNGSDVTPQQQETLDIIVRSGEHLLNLINNVLDMAKIEAGRVGLKESEVDLHRLLHEMQSLLGVGAVEKNLRFALECDPDLPRYVQVDAGKLRQVLLNLLGNAIKYTDSGTVKLRARLVSLRGDEKGTVRFEVEDTGPGVSQADAERIFVPFVQLGDQAPAQAGTGLGLAISKQYVELMGGRIGVASKPGQGSVFYFEIPVTILPGMAERDELKPRRILGLAKGQPRHRLLIAEDQIENRLLLRKLLEPLGFELREAANGQEAVALFEQWHPDLIWMDIRMPVMDGLEAVRRIRAAKAGAETKIVAITAHALEEESGPIMAAGCDALVRKPFHEQELFEALARHLRVKFIYESAPRQENAPEPPELALKAKQLHSLPAELVRDLRQAVVELDTARTQALIEQVSARDASLGRALDTLARQLNYEGLLKMLQEENVRTDKPYE
ncbi:MAG TPA: PAS domain S-box protein [Candidatus Acidoferrum sp.]|nr:PAS domain S-box protein [Candidatus Acidoferrum sp.]